MGPFKIFRAKASTQSLIHRLESNLFQTLSSWGRARKTTRKDQDEEGEGDSLLEYLEIQIQAPSPFLALVLPRFSLALPLLFARPCHDQFRFSHFRSRDKWHDPMHDFVCAVVCSVEVCSDSIFVLRLKTHRYVVCRSLTVPNYREPGTG